jgi:hypothetical protein
MKLEKIGDPEPFYEDIEVFIMEDDMLSGR